MLIPPSPWSSSRGLKVQFDLTPDFVKFNKPTHEQEHVKFKNKSKERKNWISRDRDWT